MISSFVCRLFASFPSLLITLVYSLISLLAFLTLLELQIVNPITNAKALSSDFLFIQVPPKIHRFYYEYNKTKKQGIKKNFTNRLAFF